MTGGDSWEERMAARAAARRARDPLAIPRGLAGELPPGASDELPREWCNTCGLPDAPVTTGQPTGTHPPCPRCGSEWRWYGRLADRDGTATGPPPPEGGDFPTDCPECWEWRRAGAAPHHGWGWHRICRFGCKHDHHEREVWFA